jgi:hypothetical protein
MCEATKFAVLHDGISRKLIQKGIWDGIWTVAVLWVSSSETQSEGSRQCHVSSGAEKKESKQCDSFWKSRMGNISEGFSLMTMLTDNWRLESLSFAFPRGLSCILQHCEVCSRWAQQSGGTLACFHLRRSLTPALSLGILEST